MKKTIAIGAGLAALSLLLVVGLSKRSEGQRGGKNQIELAIYAPTVPFPSSQARLQYVQGLARAIEQNTGIRVVVNSYSSYSQLRSRKPDFAIIEGQCYADSSTGKLLAMAEVGGSTSRRWALYSSQGRSLQALQGKKLAYVKTGCDDSDFMLNAMLESEVGSSFFSGRVGKPDIQAAVAEVASRKGAEGVFAPVGSEKGLAKVFDTGSVPNPAFVQLNSKVPSSIASKVASTVRSYGGGGEISGWSSPSRSAYRSLRSRMSRQIKRGLFADPSPVRVDVKDVLAPPKTLNDWDVTPVGQHFEAPPERLE